MHKVILFFIIPRWSADLVNLKLSGNGTALKKKAEHFVKIAKIEEKFENFCNVERILQELLPTQFQFYFQRTEFITFCA